MTTMTDILDQKSFTRALLILRPSKVLLELDLAQTSQNAKQSLINCFETFIFARDNEKLIITVCHGLLVY